MTRTLSAALFALLLTGCGGGGGDGGGDSPYSDIDAVAKAADCTAVTKEAEPMMFAAQTADCTLLSGSVTINWFNNNDSRDKYVAAGTSNGAVYVTGNQWAIECQTKAEQQALAKSTGGQAP